MDLNDLKRQMSQLGDVATKMKSDEEKPSNQDERFFKPTKDSAGNISCVIRFLPQIDFSKSPYVEKWGHYINQADKTFVSYCTNEGNKKGCDCVVCDKSKPYWDEYWAARNQFGREHPDCKEALKGANLYTAKAQTITNIVVVKNPADPSTEGKVFLYSMPKVVLTKYKQKLFPKDEMDEMVIIHHPLEGRDFKLDAYSKKADDKNTFIEYEKSYFYDRESAISDDENIVLKIMNETYNLNDYLAETKVDKADIEKRFNEFKKFLGISDKPRVEKTPPVVKEKKVIDEPEDDIEEVDIENLDDLFDDDDE